MIMLQLPELGWKEWVSLDKLGLDRLKVKVDTGRKISMLQAFHLQPFRKNGVQRIEFTVHPQHRRNDLAVVCVADVLNESEVAGAGGNHKKKWVIQSPITIGPHTWPIEIVLTTKADMRYRMLLGREALSGRYIVNPSESYLISKSRCETSG